MKLQHALCCLSAFLFDVGSIPAQEKTWIGSVDGSWATGGNWSPSPLAPDLESVLYDSSSTLNLTQTLEQHWSITGLRVTSAASPITILPGGGNFVLTNSGGIDLSSATADLTLLADYYPLNNGTWSVAAGRTLTVSNVLANINNATTGATTGEGTIRIVGTVQRLTDNFGAHTIVIDGGSVSGNPAVRLSAATNATITVVVTNNGSLNINTGTSTRIRLGDAASENSTNRLMLSGGTIYIVGSTSSGANGIFAGDNSGTVGILDINNGTIDMTDRPNQDSVLRIGNSVGSLGIVNLNANGRLLTPRIDRISGYAIFNFNGGYLQTVATGPYFENVDEVHIQAGGAVIDTGTRIVTIGPSFPGTGGLTKLGTGSLTLAGTNNTYAGSTVISNGSFAATLPMASSSLMLASNVPMNLTIGAVSNSSWTSSSITLQASNTLTFTYGGASLPTTTVLNTTTLSAIGTNVVAIVGAGWPAGTIRLVDYGGSIVGSGTFVLGALPVGLNARLTNNPSTTSIDLVVSSGANNLDWYGFNATGGSGGLWDIATSFNWNGGTAIYNEYGTGTNQVGDTVRFTPTGNLNVELATTLRPSSVTVTNLVGANYTMLGAGKISGPTSLIKEGNGANSTLILSTVNDYTGGTFIRIGALQLGVQDALPTAGLVYVGSPGNGASLVLNGFNQTIGGLINAGSGSGNRRILNNNATAATLTINVIANQTNAYSHTVGINSAPPTDSGNNFSIVKTGPGVQTFSGTSSYGGATTVNAGILLFNNCTSTNMNTTITVQSGGTLAAVGTGANALGTPILVQSGGRLEPGNFGVGVMTVSNSVTLQGEVIMQLNRTNSTKNDRLVANSVNLGGTLTVTNIGDPLQAGDTFNLFANALGGTFNNMSLPALSSGLVWSNSVALNGIITVLAVPRPTMAAPVLSGGNLIFSGTGGPANGTYYVRSSTNLANPVTIWQYLATNTFDGTGSFSFTNTVVPGETQRFFLLQVP